MRAGLFLTIAFAFTGCNAGDDLVTCANLACEDDNRTCNESDGTHDAICGDCAGGYVTIEGDICVLDRCAQMPDVCHEHEICVNEAETHRCDCEPGYQDLGEGCEQLVDQVALAGNHSCSITQQKIYCWGYNSNGQLGNGKIGNTSNTTPTRIADDSNNWDNAQKGQNHSCAIAQGKIYCRVKMTRRN